MTRKEITSFYQAHSRRLYNMSCRILQSPEDAEEVMHDTILKFLAMPFPPHTEEQVSAWLSKSILMHFLLLEMPPQPSWNSAN